MTAPAGVTKAVPVPMISAVGCGTARSVELLESPIFLPSAYLAHLTGPVVCRAAGRSMAPVILPGDYAVIDRAERLRLEINSRDIYLVDAAVTGKASGARKCWNALRTHQRIFGTTNPARTPAANIPTPCLSLRVFHSRSRRLA